jgi:ApbE superfamily uncharacterized protein (UPF0280 family)
MAAVAGAIAECVGIDLLQFSRQVIVENGGDIFVHSFRPIVVGILAGCSLVPYGVGLELLPDSSPHGVCTSSGIAGHSASFGKADAVVVVSDSSTASDAFATAIGNMVHTEDDFPAAIDFVKYHSRIRGVVIVANNNLAVYGNLQLTTLR